MRKATILAVLITLVMILSGCNAVAGLGRDMTLVADGVGREMGKHYQGNQSLQQIEISR